MLKLAIAPIFERRASLPQTVLAPITHASRKDTEHCAIPVEFATPFARVDSWRDSIGRPVTVMASILMGLVLQLLYVTVILMIASKIGIELKMAEWLWIFAVISLAVVLPVSLGGIGIREGAFVGVLGYLGVPGEYVLALSLTIFALQLLVASTGAILDFSRIGKAPGNR